MNGPRLKITKENSVSIMAEVENEVLTRYKLDVSDYTAKLNALGVETKGLNDVVTKGQKNIQNAANASAVAIQKNTQATQAYAAQMEKAAKAEAEFNKQLNLVLKSTSDAGKSMKQLKDEVAIVNKALESAQTGSKNFQELSKRSQELEGALKKAKDEVKGFVDQAPTLQQQYKQALKEVQEGVEGATEKAAALRDQMKSANDAVDSLATGSKLDQFNNNLGSLGDSLKGLDFNSAADSARRLSGVIGSISFKEVISGVKNFASGFGSLLTSIAGSPIFLIGAAVAGITAALYQWITGESELEKQIRKGREQLEERARVDQKEYDIAVTLAKARGASEAELNKLQDDNLKKAIKRTQDRLKLDMLELESKINSQSTLEKLYGENNPEAEKSKEISDAEKALIKTRDELDKLNADLDASRIKGIFDVTSATIKGADERRKKVIEEHKEAKAQADERKRLDEEKKKRLEDERKAEEAHLTEIIKLGEDRNKELENQRNERAKGIIGEQEQAAELIETDQKAYFDSLTHSKEFLKASLDERQEMIDEAYAAGQISLSDDIEATKELEKQRQAVYMESARVGLNALVSIFDTAAQLDGEGSAFAKVSAIFRIGLDTAKSISAVIAGATAAAASTGPAAPFVLGGYIASGIATVFGAFAQVKALLEQQPPKAPKANVQRFAEGTSLVTGGIPNTDSVDALLMPGERVVKKSDNMNYWDALEDISRGTFNNNYMHVSDIVPMLGAAVSESRSLESETQSMRIAQGILGSGKWKGENIAKVLKQMDKNESIRTKSTIKAITETKKISLRKQ